MSGQIVKLFLSLYFCACTHTVKIRQDSTNSDVERANEKVSKQVAIFTLANGSQFSAEQILIAPDSTTYYDLDSHQMKTISNRRIRHIVIKRLGRGALEGIGLGFLAAVPIGFALGAASYDENDFNIFTREQTALLSGGMVGVVGALIGIPIGMGLKSKDKIEMY
ncbi:MAG: hypothetical protein ACE5HS_10810 [bacterium]